MGAKHFISKSPEFGAGIFDPLLRLTIDEQKFREKLIELAHLEGKEKVLDIARGTGTFALMIAKVLDGGSV